MLNDYERGQPLVTVLNSCAEKIDETTNEIRVFLEQMKKRKQTSLERP